MTTLYVCLVCGFEELPYPPENWMICPCCCTMFGYSDENWGVDLLRKEWIESGAQWLSDDFPQPKHWNPIRQLSNVYEVSNEDKISIEKYSKTYIFLAEVNFSKSPSPRFFEQKDKTAIPNYSCITTFQ